MLFLCLSLTGCGYTFEEMQDMEQYKKQGEINALNYIKEKYGFDAKVVKVVCEKTDGGGDFSPPLSGSVFVTFRKDDKEFLVYIAGDEVTNTGFDNYQYEDIKSVLEEDLHTITNLPAEEIFIAYGRHKEYQLNQNSKNGMITTYFDGDNLKEVLADERPAVVVSYINQDMADIDAEAVKEKTGVDDFLFVDYDSRDHYSSIKKPYYDIIGTPINLGIEYNLQYVNEYLMTGLREDVYVSCEKKIIDDILLVTEYPDEMVTLEKNAEDIKGFISDIDKKKQVLDTYILETESERVYIYVPLDKLSTKDIDIEDVELLAGYRFKDLHVTNRLTDDGKYISAIIYTRDNPYIEFSLFVGED